MDWITWSVEFSKAWAWPVGLFAIAILFRHELRGLFKVHRMKELKYGELGITFAEEIAKVESAAVLVGKELRADTTEPAPALPSAQINPPAEPKVEREKPWGQYMQEAAEEDPRGAVEFAMRSVRKAAIATGRRLKLPTPVAPEDTFNLFKEKKVPMHEQIQGLYAGLMRSGKVLLDQPNGPTSDEALRFGGGVRFAINVLGIVAARIEGTDVTENAGNWMVGSKEADAQKKSPPSS